jgi:hypothetical protein
MMRLANSLTAAALLSVAATGCTKNVTVTRVDPASFNVNIICAGTSAASCPAVPANTGVCPAVTGPAPNLGSVTTPVDVTQTYYLAQVTAIDNNGKFYSPYNKQVSVYLQFEGNVTPARNEMTAPLQTLQFVNGQACLGITIPPAYNLTTIWVEERPTLGWLNGKTQTATSRGQRAVSGSFAIGTSQPIYRPAPLISNVNYPPVDYDYLLSPLNTKHVIINQGTAGKPLVVTAVYAGSFFVTDIGTPGTDNPWGSLDVYTYSQPVGVNVGATVTALDGAVSSFNGLTELNFPTWTLVNPNPDPVNAPIPAPHLVSFGDLQSMTKIAPWNSALAQVKTPDVGNQNQPWIICPLIGTGLTSWQKYGEWLLSQPDQPCSEWQYSINVTTVATIPAFNPLANAGKYVCSVTGILTQVVPAAGIHLWNITPRGSSDLGAIVSDPSQCPTN